MKKSWLALLLVIALLSVSCAALAAKPDYQSTSDFLAALDEEGIKYTFAGTDSDNDELVTIENTSSVYGDVTFRFYFHEDEDDVSVRVWNVIDFAPADRDAVLEMCNQQNSAWRYVRFWVDDSDNSVTMAYDAYLPKRSPGDICVNIIYAMHNILEGAYPELNAYGK